MRRVGLIDTMVGNVCASAHRNVPPRDAVRRTTIATQRASRWGHPATLARLARTVTLKSLWLRTSPTKRDIRRLLSAAPVIGPLSTQRDARGYEASGSVTDRCKVQVDQLRRQKISDSKNLKCPNDFAPPLATRVKPYSRKRSNFSLDDGAKEGSFPTPEAVPCPLPMIQSFLRSPSMPSIP